MKSRPKYRTEFVGVRLTPDEYAKVDALAKERTCSIGAVLRWAVHVAVMGEQGNAALQNAITNGVQQ